MSKTITRTPSSTTALHHDSSTKDPLQLHLSRSIYPLNSSVVGTITIANNTNTNNNNSNAHDNNNNHDNNNDQDKKNPSHNYASIKVYVAGRCRIDSRWHKTNTKIIQNSITHLYGNHPCHGELPSFVEETVADCYFKKKKNVSNSNTTSTSTSANTNKTSANIIGNGSNHSKKGTVPMTSTSTPTKAKTTTTIITTPTTSPTKKKKNQNQTFCYWSTNVLTLLKNGNEINVPIYEADGPEDDDDDDDDVNGDTNKANDNIQTRDGVSSSDDDDDSDENDDDASDENDDDASSASYENDDDDENDEESQNDNDMEEEGKVESQNHHRRRPKTLIMNNSEWYNLGTKIVEMMQEEGELNDDDHDIDQDLEYDDGDDDDDHDHDDSSSNENSIFNEDDFEEVVAEEKENDDHDHDHEDDIGTTTATATTITKPMNFTFKADLPRDLPPTANAASARYFYSVVLVAQTIDGDVQIYQAPFTVVTPKVILSGDGNNESGSSDHTQTQQTKIRIGTIHAIAHPTVYPISLSSTYAASPWRTSIQRVNGGWDPSNVRSIMMEEGGYKCAILTIVGGVIMVPGEKVMLRFDFVHDDDESSVISDTDDDGSTCIVKRDALPCHMVCACLKGEENAIGVDGSTKTRSRSYMFDTTYAHVDPDCTKSISLNLSLPLDCPVTLSTDLVTIEVNCRVDMTVRMPNSNSFKFLTVQFPCQVVSDLALGQEPNDDSHLSNELVSNIMHHRRTNEKIEACNKVICPEVLDDLSMLSMHVSNKK